MKTVSELQSRCDKLEREKVATITARLIFFLYRFSHFRKIAAKLAARLENGHFFSKTLRRIYVRYHDVHIGQYSYGGCFSPGVFPEGSVIGNYCSFGSGLKVFRRNHPVDFLSQHPFFYNKHFGFVENDRIPKNTDNPLNIGNDVWVGSGVTILPNCRNIGDGAIIGADSVVTTNVPDFAIAVGNPARVVGFRFENDICTLIKQSKWWNFDSDTLLKASGTFLFSKFSKAEFEVVAQKLDEWGHCGRAK